MAVKTERERERERERLSGRRRITPSSMCSSAVASITVWQHALERVVNTLNVHMVTM